MTFPLFCMNDFLVPFVSILCYTESIASLYARKSLEVTMEKRTHEAAYAAKQAICTSLKRLMTQKSLNKITISEIMQNCGMARQHFYYHFEDIYDLVRWMFEEEAVSLLQRHEGAMLWKEGLMQLFQYLQDNRAVCLCALHSIEREHLKRFFQADLHAIIQHTIECVANDIGSSADPIETKLLTQFYIGALMNMIESWLLGEIDQTPQELISFTDTMLRDQVRGTSIRLTGTLPKSEKHLWQKER